MKTVYYYDFPIGKLAIASDGEGITDISFGYVDGIEAEEPLTAECARQLYEYFDGARREFDLPLSLDGTPFQRRVWDALMTVPYGETRSYGDIARQIGNPRGSRAVGGAVHRNRIMIVIPCQRIISGDGSIGGYAGRVDVKRHLLNLEKERK